MFLYCQNAKVNKDRNYFDKKSMVDFLNIKYSNSINSL